MKHYSDGVYSKKQFIFLIFYMILLFVIATVIGSLVAIYTSFNIFIDLLITILVVIIGGFFFMYFNSRFNSPTTLLKQFMLDNDLNRLLNGFDKLLEEKLSPDTRSYVESLKAYYTFPINKEEAFRLFENINVPKNKAFFKEYCLVELMYYLNKEDVVNFNNKVSYYEINYPKAREIEPIKFVSKVLLTTDEIENVEQIFSIETPYDFQNLDNCNTLCVYFDKRNNSSKAIYYANKMLELAPINSQYYLFATTILNKYNSNISS